tara:strand:+ start:412 stop:897 length:486 start_codon:yes stop_codon:yes gene_type:complete
MIFKIKRHNSDFYNKLLILSRNIFFYNKILLKDTFETRVYLMFMHFSIILKIFKKYKVNFPQNEYDNLFRSIENDLRELALGDVAVNKKMKELNKIFYNILLKISLNEEDFKINKRLVLNYFSQLIDVKYDLFDEYFTKFYHFCFELGVKNMIKDIQTFKV